MYGLKCMISSIQSNFSRTRYMNQNISLLILLLSHFCSLYHNIICIRHIHLSSLSPCIVCLPVCQFVYPSPLSIASLLWTDCQFSNIPRVRPIPQAFTKQYCTKLSCSGPGNFALFAATPMGSLLPVKSAS